MTRNLIDVRESILDAIPNVEILEKLEEETNSTIRGYIYSSPENKNSYWKEFSMILNRVVGNPDDGTEWKKEVQKIFSGVDDSQP